MLLVPIPQTRPRGAAERGTGNHVHGTLGNTGEADARDRDQSDMAGSRRQGHTLMRRTTEDEWNHQVRPVGADPHAAGDRDRLVRRVLAEVERLYERNTNPLLL